MFQYILLDFDGTICDSAEGIVKCVQYALRDQGIEEPLENLYCFCGPPLADMFQAGYGMTPEQALHAVDKYRERYNRTGVWESRLYDGMDTLIRDLRAAGRKLAVASSKPVTFIRQLLDRFGILNEFDAIVGAELDGSFGHKAEVVERALALLGVTEQTRSQAVLVGDRHYDVDGAHAQHIACIGAGYGYAEPEELVRAGADLVVPSVAALRSLLLAQEATV